MQSLAQPPETGDAALALVAGAPSATPVGFALLDDAGVILVASPSLGRLLGAPGEDLAGRALDTVLPAAVAQPIGELVERERREGGADPIQVGEPSERWLVIARRSGDGITGLIVNDITERSAIAVELRESESQLEAAQRIAAMGWWVHYRDAPDELVYSPALAEILGAERAVGDHAWLVAAEDDPELLESGVIEHELRVRRPDGVPVRLALRGMPILGAAGEVIGLQGMAQDVTASERAGRLQRALAELGRAGLGHGSHEELREQACRLVAEALDVESVSIPPAGDDAAAPEGAAAVLRSAIPGPGAPRGTVVVATEAPREFGKDEAAFVENVAHVLGEAIARRDADDEIAELAAARGRLVGQALEAEARARRGISDRLHDGPLQDLLAAGHDLYGLGEGPDAIAAQNRLRAIARDLREVMAALHPTVLRYGGLAAALRAVTEQQARHAGLRARITVDADATGVHDELLLSVARLLVGDATHHDGATAITVAVRLTSETIELEIASDGRHGPGRAALATVAERVAAFGGELAETAGATGGTSAVVTLPVR